MKNQQYLKASNIIPIFVILMFTIKTIIVYCFGYSSHEALKMLGICSSQQSPIVTIATTLFLHFDLIHFLTNCIMLVLLYPIFEKSISSKNKMIVSYSPVIVGLLINTFEYFVFPKGYTFCGISGAIMSMIGYLFILNLKNREGDWATLGLYSILIIVNILPTSGQVDIFSHIVGVIGGIILFFIIQPNNK